MTVTSDWYTRFAAEARGESALYTEWAEGVAVDAPVLDILERLPRPKRQPPLIFAVSRLLGAPVEGYPVWREWVLAHADELVAEALQRTTQTNEPRRAAALVPLLAAIADQTAGIAAQAAAGTAAGTAARAAAGTDATPLALVEIGASAGLCLYPDRYSYLFDGVRLDPADGPSPVLIECTTLGEPPTPMLHVPQTQSTPQRQSTLQTLPPIAWRAGLDLTPLDVTNVDDMHWLETLVWPEQHSRRERIREAITIARADPPHLVAGDAVRDLAALVSSAAAAAPDATVVVITVGVLVYLSVAERAAFVAAVSELDVRWISLEGPTVLPGVAAQLPPRAVDAPDSAPFVLALDGTPVAFCAPYGHVLHWIDHHEN